MTARSQTIETAARELLTLVIERHGIQTGDDFVCPKMRALYEAVNAPVKEPFHPPCFGDFRSPQSDAENDCHTCDYERACLSAWAAKEASINRPTTGEP